MAATKWVVEERIRMEKDSSKLSDRGIGICFGRWFSHPGSAVGVSRFEGDILKGGSSWGSDRFLEH